MKEDPRQAEARVKLEVIARARAFNALTESEGWKALQVLRRDWLNQARADLRRQATASNEAAVDALRRWQLAEDLMELEQGFINVTLDEAREITSGLGLDEALLMEQIRHEQSDASGDPGPGTDPTGYR